MKLLTSFLLFATVTPFIQHSYSGFGLNPLNGRITQSTWPTPLTLSFTISSNYRPISYLLSAPVDIIILKPEVESIGNKAEEAIRNVNDSKELETLRVSLLGKKGTLTSVMSKMKDLSKEDKKEVRAGAKR